MNINIFYRNGLETQRLVMAESGRSSKMGIPHQFIAGMIPHQFIAGMIPHQFIAGMIPHQFIAGTV